MAKKSRKRKLGGDEEVDHKWELTNILTLELREEMATMWEIPQIFHFLHLSKEALNLTTNLSMYEMERMLAMPQASKQLAHIMTCLLSHPLPKTKMRKIPPMPYEFWVNVLFHKIQGWYKVYQSKHQDIVKVFDSIGVEPEFWRILPEVMDGKNFIDLTFKQRVWILKTLCDTLMHSRKTIQDEIAKNITEDSYEIVLGADRYGAKFIYFPIFLENDFRVYRHSMDNTVMSTAKPPPWKECQGTSVRSEKKSRVTRKRSRWKNGALPRDKKRSRKTQDENMKMSGDSAIGSSMNDDTNFSGTSTCSNNNNIALESIDGNRSRSPSKTSEQSGLSMNPKSSGYDTNTSVSDAKSFNDAESEEMFRGFGAEPENDSNVDAIDSIHDILNRLTTKVSETMTSENSTNDDNSTIDESATVGNEDEDGSSSNVPERKLSGNECLGSRSHSPSDDLDWSKYSPRKTEAMDPETMKKELMIFSGILADLSSSTFELAADSIDSLRDLAATLMVNDSVGGRVRPVPKCELRLARAMEDLAESMKDVESILKESTRKAKTKIKREWMNFKEGNIEDQDASGEVESGSNPWVIGSQGCPQLSISEESLSTLSDSALSQSDNENTDEKSKRDGDDVRTRRKPKVEFKDVGGNNKDEKVNERRVRIKIEKHESDDDENSKDSEPQTRRVLRARGISSYTEQLSSEEEDAYELEEWARTEALNSTASTSDGTSGVNTSPGIGQNDAGSEAKDSDQDWILPGARKRKNKRSLEGNVKDVDEPVRANNRRVKASPQKASTTTPIEPRESISNVSPPVPDDPLRINPRRIAKEPTNALDGSFICKVESVHSELDIKDEGPIFDTNRGNVSHGGVIENYLTPQHNPLIRPASNPRPPRPQPPMNPGMTPHQQLPPGYYVQGMQTYFDPRYVRFPYRTPIRMPPMNYSYPPQQPPVIHQYPGRPPNYWQPPNYPPLPPGVYGSNPRAPLYPPPRGVVTTHQRHPGPSTTLYGARLPNKPPPNRMPVPRPSVGPNIGPRGPMRPRAPAPPGPTPRRYLPRNVGPQNPPNRMLRPSRPIANPPVTKKPAEKSTSLILLSDSDDEIEMIVPAKKITEQAASPGGQTRRTVVPPKNRQVANAPANAKSRPIVTSQITVSKSNEVLSPQMIQRMSQGGISITPVKPPASKQKSDDNAQGTKLVVVVNETGSHYALALPNGGKLILTPEQVAQIRASNGGKLVL